MSPFGPGAVGPMTPPLSPETFIRPKLQARAAESKRPESSGEEYEEDEEDLEMRRYLGRKAPGKKESLMDLLNSAPPGWKDEPEMALPPASPTASIRSQPAKLSKAPSMLSKSKFSFRSIRNKSSSTALPQEFNSPPLRSAKSSASLGKLGLPTSSRSHQPTELGYVDLPPLPRKFQTKDAVAERSSTADLANFLKSSAPPGQAPPTRGISAAALSKPFNESGWPAAGTVQGETRARSATMGHIARASTASVARLQEALNAANTAALKKLSEGPLSAYGQPDNADSLSVHGTVGERRSSIGSSNSLVMDDTEVISTPLYKPLTLQQRKLSPVRPNTGSSFGLDDWSDAVSQLNESPIHSPRNRGLNSSSPLDRTSSLASNHSLNSPGAGLSPNNSRRLSRKPFPNENDSLVSSPTRGSYRDRPFADSSPISAFQALLASATQPQNVDQTKKPLLDLSPRSKMAHAQAVSPEVEDDRHGRRPSVATFGPGLESPSLREERPRSSSRGVARSASVVLAEGSSVHGSARESSETGRNSERSRSRPLTPAPEEPLAATPDAAAHPILEALERPQRHSSLPQHANLVALQERGGLVSPEHKRNSMLDTLSLQSSPALAAVRPIHAPADSVDSFVDPPLVQVPPSSHSPEVLAAFVALQEAMRGVGEMPLPESDDSIQAIVPVLRGLQTQFEAAARLVGEVIKTVRPASLVEEPIGLAPADVPLPGSEDGFMLHSTAPLLMISGMPGALTMDGLDSDRESTFNEDDEVISSDESEEEETEHHSAIQRASVVIRSSPPSPVFTRPPIWNAAARVEE